MRNLTIYVTLTLLCTIAFIGQSADTSNKQNSKFEVEVLVECDNENTKAFIESHIKRELRSLQDVEIVKKVFTKYKIVDFKKYKLSIVAVESEYKSTGQKVRDIVVAYSFHKRFNRWSVMDKLPRSLDLNKWREIALLTDDLYHYGTTGLTTGITDELDKICKGIVVDFDTEMLEPDRNGK